MNATVAPAAASLLFRQLAIAADAGLPLADVLGALASDPEVFGDDHPPIALLADALTASPRLSAALQALPELFSAELVAMVAAAEERSRLPAVLDALARDFALIAESRAAVRAATIWPRYLGSLYLVLLLVMTMTVIPQFKNLYSAFGTELPAPTRVLVAISDAMVSFGWVLALALIVLFLLRKRLPRGLRAALQGALFPGYSAYRIGRFSARLALWLAACKGETELLRAALRHLAVDAGFAPLEASVASLDSRLAAGLSVPDALDGLPLLPRYLSRLERLAARVPDATATLDHLVHLSNDYSAISRERFTRRLTLASYLIVGAALGATIIAMYLPIFKLSGQV